jgi:ABC-type thiamin/hydroxymethylpyrimidine transport system permease subunit
MKKIVLIVLLAMLTLIGVWLVWMYQNNVFEPAASPFSVYTTANQLNTSLWIYSNYDIVSIMPYKDGFIIIYKNRNKLIDMWQ